MSDNIFVKYSQDNPNFYDGYWRNNPRRNAKCSSMLYGDSYRNHFQKPVNFTLSNNNMCVVEGFANPSTLNNNQVVDATKIRKMHSLVNQNPPQLALQENDTYLDNYERGASVRRVVLTNDFSTVGIGSGQPSRLDSCEIAVSKMRKFNHKTENLVAASDAFFPFVDGIETLVQAGVRAVIQPSGSIKDKEIIKFANQTETILVFSKTRHFKH